MDDFKEEQCEDPPSPSYSLPSSPLQDTLNPLEPEKEFILAFKSFPELWNPRNPNYTDKYKRYEQLSKLVVILRKIKPESEVEDVRKKINTLRSNYRRDLKKVIMTENTEEPFVPKSWAFPYLSFLRTIEKHKPATTKHTKDDTDLIRQSIDFIPEEECFVPTTNVDALSTQTDEPSPKTRKMTQESRNEYIERRCQEILSTPSKKQKTQSMTILCHPIALEWAQTLEKLDSKQRLFAKKAINDILYEAELGNLHKDSVKINDSSTIVAIASDDE